MKKLIYLLIVLLFFAHSHAQSHYWQQKIDYDIYVNMDEDEGTYQGKQDIKYTNHSSDTLHRIFMHLYFNAFKPNSMMDVRSRNIADPDPRVRDRIVALEESDQGNYIFTDIRINEQEVSYHIDETILEIKLNQALLPGESASIYTNYKAQIPLQIRRSGKNNKEGIDFSMTQWYPKVCEYDQDGWHPNPYVGREFYGVLGAFDVYITIDKNYVIGASGILQNPKEIGYGYVKRPKRPRSKRPTWHFRAENVHDFAWAADRDYAHEFMQIENGPEWHVFYDKNLENAEDWMKVGQEINDQWSYIESRFGEYPYPIYSVIQGGDGGMEYPMATLITGNRKYGSLRGVTVHELMHSWYQGVLATDEAQYAFMDEGFTTYASSLIAKQMDDPESDRDPMAGLYEGYRAIVLDNIEEPLTTLADHFEHNRAYGIASYVKGALYLHQLSYIVGEAVQKQALLRYYNDWKFKHPTPNDFIRCVEKESGMVLDWYQNYWLGGTKHIDYQVDTVYSDNKEDHIVLERVGEMPMPIDLQVTYSDSAQSLYHIPLQVMRGNKIELGQLEGGELMPDWPWTHPKYQLDIANRPGTKIIRVEIDPTDGMADINRDNNIFKIMP